MSNRVLVCLPAIASYSQNSVVLINNHSANGNFPYLAGLFCRGQGNSHKQLMVHNNHPIDYGAPGRNRTSGTRFRKPLLYPLSYGAGSYGIIPQMAVRYNDFEDEREVRSNDSHCNLPPLTLTDLVSQKVLYQTSRVE